SYWYLPRVAREAQRQRPTRPLIRSSARRQALRPPGNRHQQSLPVQPLGHSLGILDGHRVDQGGSALDVVDAKVVDLDLRELRCNLARSVERQGIGALQE